MVLCEEGVGGAMLLSIANVLLLCGSEWLFCSAKMQTAFFCFGQESHLTGGEYGDGCRLGRRGAICPGSGGWREVRMRRRAKVKQKENRGWGRMSGRALRAARRG